MTITELRYIVALNKERHFGKAAESVFVSQPTLSIGIKKLEEELDVILFERLSSNIIPTQAGKRVIALAEKILADTQQIKSIAKQEKEEPFGRVKLGVIYTISPYFMPDMMVDLKERTPEIKLFIHEDYTDNLISQLKSGHIDIALMSLPINDSHHLEVAPLFEEPFSVIVPKKHKLSEQLVIHSEDIASELLFLLGSEHCFRSQAIATYPLDSANRDSEDAIIQGASLETIRLMVASGLGISIFPNMAAHSSQHNNQLISVKRFPDPEPRRKIALVWRKSYQKTAVINAIKQSIIQQAKQYPFNELY